jgi:hypothetical protein
VDFLFIDVWARLYFHLVRLSGLDPLELFTAKCIVPPILFKGKKGAALQKFLKIVEVLNG